MADIATLGFAVDSEPLLQAEGALDGVTAAAKQTENAAGRVEREWKQLSGAASGASTATKNLGASQQAAATAMTRATISVKQQAQAMRQLPAQITDIVTSLVSGQSAYLVAVQQGGQLKDSFGGVGAAVRALGGAIGPVGGILAGAAATIGTFTALVSRGEKETSDFAKAILLTGNAAGTTVQSLTQMAERLDQFGGTSRSRASEVLGELVSTAQVGSTELERFTKIAIDAQDVLGLGAEDIAKAFAELGRDPVQGTLKLNSAMHYLTASTMAQINADTRAGDTIGAVRVAQNAFADALATRTHEMHENLGIIESGWLALQKVIGETKDAALRFDARPPTANITGARIGGPPLKGSEGGLFGIDTAGQQRALSLLEVQEKLRKGMAAEALTATQRLDAQTNSLMTTQERYNKALEQTKSDFQTLRATGQAPPEEQARALERLRQSFLGPPTADADVARIQRQATAVLGVYENAQAALEQALQQRQITEASYADQSIGIIQREASIRAAALMKEAALISSEIAIGDRKTANQTRSADLVAQAAVIERDGRAKVLLILKDEQDRVELLNRAYQSARDAQQDFVDGIARGTSRQIAGLTSSPSQRRFSEGVWNIQDQTRGEIQRRDNQLSSGKIGQEQFEQYFDDILNAQQSAIEKWTAGFAQMEAAASNFGVGFRGVVQEYLDANKNLGANLGNNVVGAIDQATSATAQLATNTLLWGESGTEAAKAIGRALLTDLVSGLIKVGLQMGVNFALQEAFTATSTAVATAAAAELALAWSPAAIGASIATLGAADDAGVTGYAAALTAGAAISQFRGGGYTGNLGTDQVAGVVHGREYVFDADATQRIGVRNLEAMRAGATPVSHWMAAPASRDSAPPQFVINNLAPGVTIKPSGNTLTVEMLPELMKMFDNDQANRTISGRGAHVAAIGDKFGLQGRERR